MSKGQKKLWAIVTGGINGNRYILAKLEDKQEALECAESLRRLAKLEVHVEPLLDEPKNRRPRQ